MSRPKLPQEFSLEELLASVEGISLNSEIKPNFDTPILSFIQAFNIIPGKELVSDSVLYKLFKYWHVDSFIDKQNFNIQMSKYVPSVVKSRRFYQVNKNALDIENKIQSYSLGKKRDKTKSIAWKKHFELFLEDTKLEEGSIFIEGDILFYIYNNWCDEKRKKATFGYRQFTQICSLYFERKKINHSDVMWFGLNDKIKNLIYREEVERWRKGRQVKKDNKNEIKKPKKRYQNKHNGIILYPKKKKKSKIKV